MSLVISEYCIACSFCENVCPNDAITLLHELYVIHPDFCSECVGISAVELCKEICPVDVISEDENHPETEDELRNKTEKLHQLKLSGDYPSKFKLQKASR